MDVASLPWPPCVKIIWYRVLCSFTGEAAGKSYLIKWSLCHYKQNHVDPLQATPKTISSRAKPSWAKASINIIRVNFYSLKSGKWYLDTTHDTEKLSPSTVCSITWRCRVLTSLNLNSLNPKNTLHFSIDVSWTCYLDIDPIKFLSRYKGKTNKQSVLSGGTYRQLTTYIITLPA